MDEKKKAYLETDLTEADKVILRLYEETAEPIEWDKSDDAILSMARGATSGGVSGESGAETTVATPPGETGPANDPGVGEGSDDKVVPFAKRRTISVSSFFRSPAVGFSIAASLMIGIFAGQGVSPYVNFGVGPDYGQLVDENTRLKQEVEVAVTRSLKPRIASEERVVIEREAGADLKDLANMMANFTCANLSVTLSEGLNLLVSGHVGSADDLLRLQNNLGVYGQTAALRETVQVHDWPFCEAIDVLASQTRDDLSGLMAPTIQPYNHSSTYFGGEDLILEARASSGFDGYVYVDYVQHDGHVLHLLPTTGRAENQIIPGQSVLIGNGAQRYTLVPPFGTDMILIIQSPEPLFAEMRDEAEPAESYFAALQQALAGLEQRGLGDKVLSSYHFITTQAEGSEPISQD